MEAVRPRMRPQRVCLICVKHTAPTLRHRCHTRLSVDRQARKNWISKVIKSNIVCVVRVLLNCNTIFTTVIYLLKITLLSIEHSTLTWNMERLDSQSITKTYSTLVLLTGVKITKITCMLVTFQQQHTEPCFCFISLLVYIMQPK